ncbi:MAG: toxin-antitoxin system HicB family antitoxin [Thermoplasmata archaeon]|nr:MAG: toxin-antitoxin system HicB family antitoxin [Thermoplasmata archaeon]
MEKERKYTKNLRVRVEPELFELAKEEARKHNTDLSTFVRWCIRTGLYLKDVNIEMKSKSKEE